MKISNVILAGLFIAIQFFFLGRTYEVSKRIKENQRTIEQLENRRIK